MKLMQFNVPLWYYPYVKCITYVCQLNLSHCKAQDKSNDWYLWKFSRSYCNNVGKSVEQWESGRLTGSLSPKT